MSTHDRSDVRRRGLLVLLALSVVALSTTAGSRAANDTSKALPRACKLLTRSEAQVLVGIKLQRPNDLGRACMYTGYPTGPLAQVELYVDSSIPRTLQIDRTVLHHKFWPVPRLGDQALEEEWNIFVRKGSVWITIHLVRNDAWPQYRTRLERAARIAISRVRPAARHVTGLRSLASVSKDPPASGGRERWTGKERRYGGSITNYAGVTYQPGVVLIGGGANAIRAESPDGLTWTIDANAPGASDLRVGKIMLATTFAAGRVLKLTRVGPSLKVILGPAALTDVIREGTFKSNGPVRLTSPLSYKMTFPKNPSKRRKTQATSGGSRDFTADAFWRDGGGLGVSILHDNGASHLSATVQLYMGTPSVEFDIRIGGGQLLEAGLQLHGLGGLRYEIVGRTHDVSDNVKSDDIVVPGSFTFPLAGPLAITLTQAFDVSMQLAAQASIDTRGDYIIRGTLGFGYHGSSPQRKDTGLHKETRTAISKNTLSLGVGVNALSLGWKVRATVGIGGGGFAAGAWGELRSGLGLEADGSHLNSLKFGCTTVSLDITSKYGVGYTMPDYVKKIVNTILSIFGAKPIAASGGVSFGPYAVWHPPQAEWCPPRK
jgi:hypothetical protein